MNYQKTTNKIILLIIITVVFYAIIVLFSDVNLLVQRVGDFEFKYLPIIFAGIGFHIFILGIKFHRLAIKAGINLPFKENLKIYTAGLSLGVTPGGIGTAIKSHILKVKHGKSISSTLPIVVVERWTELLGILILTTALLFWSNTSESIAALVIGYVILGIFLALISNSKIFLSLKQILTKIKFINKLVSNLDESRESLIKLNTKKNFTEATAWSILAKLAHLVTVYFIFLAYGVDLGLIVSGQVYYTAMIFGVVSFIPGGIVITESSMLGLLLNHNIEFTIATLIVILTRIITMWFTTFVGLFSLKLNFSNIK